MNKLLVLFAFIPITASSVQRQSFSSGSTGVDGALDLATMNCSNNVCLSNFLNLVFLNYTTVWAMKHQRALRFREHLVEVPIGNDKT